MKVTVKYLFILALLAISLANVDLSFASASEAQNELAQRVFMPQGTQLQEYGISHNEGKVEFLSVLKSKGKNIYRYITIKNGNIALRKARKSEINSLKQLPLRMAVLTSPHQTSAYFYKQVKKNVDIAAANDIAENNWRAIFIQISPEEHLYIWYEPSEFQKTTIDLDHSKPDPDDSFAENVRLYPNPVTNARNAELKFSLASPQILSIALYDVNGREVANILNNQYLAVGNHEYSIPSEYLNDGMYVVYITNDKGQSISKKLVKLR